MSREGKRFIRSMHPYAYKGGEWAEIVGESFVRDRWCYDILFSDGSVDTWPKSDPVAEYEFAHAAPQKASGDERP